MPVREDHQELLIVKGVAAAKGDTASAELGLVSINLLADKGEPGWSLDAEDGWSPKRAQLKGGGTWADSAVSSGRTLVAGEDANVIETLQLTVTGTSILDLAAQLTRMGRMRQAVIGFWTDPREIDPVYLLWYAKEGAGPQYALIYAMDVAEEEPDVWQNPIRDVTIMIEREPYWRGKPPGQNPKVWTHTQIRHVNNYTVDDLNLVSSGATSDVNHALSGTLSNNDISPNNNYAEISAANVPGDAPALLQLSLSLSTAIATSEYYIAAMPEPFAYPNLAGSFISTIDPGALGTDAALAGDGDTASGQRVNITPGTATDALRVTFSVTVPEYQGRYAVYLRAYQSAVTAGDWKAHIEVNAAPLFLSAGTPTIVLPESTFGTAAFYQPVYMGEIQLPVGIEAGMTILGTGIETTTYSILLYARRTAGASVLRIADLILMPLDNGHAYVTASFDTTKSSTLVIDNTGYLSHGKPGDFAAPLIHGGTGIQTGLAEYRGPSLYLTPRKTNRIYVINYHAAAGGVPDSTFSLRGNIIPRWVGVRDV